MFHSKLLSAGLLLLAATPVCSQVINVPLGAPLPNFQPGASYNFAPGYQLPPGGFAAPANTFISIGGVVFSMSAAQQAMGISGAAQDAARAAAARGEGAPNFQFLVPLDGLNVNVLDGGVTLPADVGTPMLIQSGSSLMIGSTPPMVGGGSAKTATGSDGSKSSESKSGDADKSGKENEKGRPSDTALSGKDSSGGSNATNFPTARPSGGSGKDETAAVVPTPAFAPKGGGVGAPPEKISTIDPVPSPKDPKSVQPLVPEQPKTPDSPPRVVAPVVPNPLKPGDPQVPDQPRLPDAPPRLTQPVVPTPRTPRPVEPTPTGTPRTVVATPIDVRTRDPVAERIDQGLERDIGATPPIMHRINSAGVAVPDCMGASREGLACD